MISRAEALRLVRSTSKYEHVLMVSVMLRGLAKYFGANEREWELVGLLHDLDYDEVRGDMSQHGVVTSARLKGRLPTNCLHAIEAHDYRTGFEPRSRLDKALIATDSLAVLIEKTGKSLNKVDAETVLAGLESVSVNQPWHKRNVLRSEEIDLTLKEILKLCLDSLQESEIHLP
jgi:hypothetical protein